MGVRRASALVIAVAALVTAGPARSAEVCDKNHYILDEPPCLRMATAEAIGRVGAVAVDNRGGFYFSTPNVVFHVDRDGFQRRVAGNGTPGFAGDGGPAIDALLSFPLMYPWLEFDSFDFEPLYGPLAVDAQGNLYIGDTYNSRVRKVDTDGYIRTVAGNGKFRYYYWYRGENGVPATDVAITWPAGVAARADGTILVASGYGPVFQISPQGIVGTVRANCGCCFQGPSVCAPQGLALDASGDLVVPAFCGVRRLRADGRSLSIAGADGDWSSSFARTCGYSGDGGAALDAAMRSTAGVAADRHGNVYVADHGNSCVRRVDAVGRMSTIAGQCTRSGFSGDDGPATSALLSWPRAVAVDSVGNVYIADTLNHRIRKVGVDGIITTVAGNGGDVPTLPATNEPIL